MMTQTILLKPVSSVQERTLITIEFAPHVHPEETEYSHPHPLFVFGDKVEIGGTSFNYPPIIFTVCALELVESVTPSGKLLSQPYWKYKITDGEKTFWKEETALARWSEQQSTDICANCQHFQDFNEHDRGWCGLFDRSSRTYHQKTNDCFLNDRSEEREEDIDKPYSQYQVGSIVKVIDSAEHHSEWATFEVVECKYNPGLYRSSESYLNESHWYYRLASNDDATTVSKSLWVAEDEICHFDMSHNVCTEEIF
ncbi:MAG: hypothetical protein QNJ72_08470 [Pleurocapsa sp. MO_226.B13]|nr:hypothetical protein [Pleurocapsa sp. MO_226.B13]